LAKEGLLFMNVITQGIWTPPTLASIMTSTYLHTHGVDWGYVLNPSLLTLAGILKSNGYVTVAFKPEMILQGLDGLKQGFDSWNINFGADKVTYEAISYVKEALHKNKPFFLWIHYFETHSPYNVPEPYSSRYPAYDLIDVPVLKYEGSKYAGRGGIPSAVAKDGITNLNYYIAQYDGAINFVDAQIGLLLQNLEDLSLDKNTLYVITADHGEYLGEHDIYFSHILPFYNEVIKVPLIIRYKGTLPENKTIMDLIQSIDIMPTIIKLAGIKRPRGLEGIDIFSPLGKIRELFYPRIAISEYTDQQRLRAYSIIERDWKFMSIEINHEAFVPITIEKILFDNNFHVINKKDLRESSPSDNSEIELKERNTILSIVDWVKRKPYTPLLWFHYLNKSDPLSTGILPQNIYLTDLDYYLSSSLDKSVYTTQQIRILLDELDKLKLNKKRVIFFTIETKVRQNEGNDLRMRIKDGNWQILYYGFPPSSLYFLFNLKDNPYEKNNLFLHNPKQVDILKKRYISLIKKHQIRRPTKIILDAETKEHLRSLGYMQ
jgi:hypothetical protein